MSAEMEVHKASEQFYAALNRMLRGDADALSAIWSHGAAVTTMHPIGGRQVGWNDVQSTWKQVAQLVSDGQVDLKDQRIHVAGDEAYETGVEQGQFKLAGQRVAVEHRVTNIYQREAGGWKIIHHHTDASPEMQHVLSQSQAASREAR